MLNIILHLHVIILRIMMVKLNYKLGTSVTNAKKRKKGDYCGEVLRLFIES